MQTTEAERLEQLWSGAFGDAYVDRNARAGGGRGPFWSRHFERFPARSALEVGSNTGANLRHIVEHVAPHHVWGLDVNAASLRQCRATLPDVNTVWGVARALPFADEQFDLTLSVAVLIHQADEALTEVVRELVRCASRFIAVIEYDAPTITEVVYRDQRGAFFKRPWAEVILQICPNLVLREDSDTSKAEGFDDGLRYIVFEKA